MYRMTHEKTNGRVGYWSPNKKEEVVNRLATYENTGLEPRQVQELKKKILEQSSKSNDGWIPVGKDNIPQKEVLACDRYGEMMIGYLTYVGGPDSEFDSEFICESSESLMSDVLAWRPLPEPYKPERSEEK